MKETIRVQSPASVANVGCGYDVLGFAIDLPSDELVLTLRSDSKLNIRSVSGAKLPTDPDKNVATVAIAALLNALESKQGFDLDIDKKLTPGSGLGSSASAAASAVYAANKLLGSPFTKKELLPFAMAGEVVASKKPHADNISPALLGGFTVVRSIDPLDVFNIDYPKDFEILIIFPDVEIKTSEARKLIGNQISIDKARIQWGNMAGLVTGLMTANWDLIGNSVHDELAEPVRKYLIPGYERVKELVLAHGANAFNISGSGPCMFAFYNQLGKAAEIISEIQQVYQQLSVNTFFNISRINPKGTITIE
jgi:homoserine kinase